MKGFIIADALERFQKRLAHHLTTKPDDGDKLAAIDGVLRSGIADSDMRRVRKCLSSFLTTSLSLVVANEFSPLLLVFLSEIKGLQRFLALSKLVSGFPIARNFYYAWIAKNRFNRDIGASALKESLYEEFVEACYAFVLFDLDFAKANLFLGFFDLTINIQKGSYVQWLQIKILACISNISPKSTPELLSMDTFTEDQLAEYRIRAFKLTPSMVPAPVDTLVRYEEVGDITKEHQKLYEDVIDVAGILFPCSETASKFVPDPREDFIVLESLEKKFQELAFQVACGKPVLLEGPIACGKSAMIAHLAKYTGRVTAPEIVTVQISDQVDSKYLLGSYVCTDQPGEFVFNLGPLLRAINTGNWIVLEDIDLASSDIATLVQAIVETNSVASIPGCEGKISGFNRDFRIFFTRRVDKQRLDCDGRHVITLLKKVCAVIDMRELSSEDIKNLLQTKWKLSDVIATLLVDIYSSVSSEERVSDPNNSKRHVCLRDIFKLCKRGLRTDPSDLLLDIVDLFVDFTDDPSFVQRKSHIIASWLNITSNVCDLLLNQRTPNLTLEGNMLSIGRQSIGRRDCAELPKFAFTQNSLVLLEKLLVAVSNREPVLLCGETGVGKTSCVQFLAQSLGKKLVVMNMNQQSESAELFGGYKPVDMKYWVDSIKDDFLDAVCKSSKQNDSFYDQFKGQLLQRNWPIIIQTMNLVANKFFQNSSTVNAETEEGKVLRNMWSKLISRLEPMDAHRKTSHGLMFSFVDGALTKAMKMGHWVLLDEINLAEAETLQSLLSIFDGSNTVALHDKVQDQDFQIHPDFTIFACMNPATDVGKRSLPIGIQTRFTEFVIPELTEPGPLRTLVETYIGSLFSNTSVIMNLVNFYLQIKAKAESSVLKDLNGHRPIYSLRNLCRALRLASVNPFDNSERSLYECLNLAFLTNLDQQSSVIVMKDIEKIFKNVRFLKQNLAAKPGCSVVCGYPIPDGERVPKIDEDYIQTETVTKNLQNICRIISAGKTLPILLQGETSVGKTSMITWLAKATGHTCIRVNNHEHTDIQEYIGSYGSDESGKIVFKEGVLVTAMRNGSWLILDELNLAPTDVLESLNRVLDDNRELFIPETQELIKAHPQFILFATQNPPGKYGGRKMLSRAFRNRFIELGFAEIPAAELKVILTRKCQMPPSYADRMVTAMVELQRCRSHSDIFAGKNGLITLRDLFRWGKRYKECSSSAQFFDYDSYVAKQGYYLLAGRARNADECRTIREILSKIFKFKLDDEEAFYTNEFSLSLNDLTSQPTPDGLDSIVWTKAFKRMAVLIQEAIRCDEPVLLVGETGCGKTTIVQYFAAVFQNQLKILNCHMNTESSDFLGSYRPNRESDLTDSHKESALFNWVDGPLIRAMKDGDYFLIDEISLADDSVLERLNSLFEETRTIFLTEGKEDEREICAVKNFRCFATMNPGGDFGKKELSPAFRDRFTEIWCTPFVDGDDIKSIIAHNLKHDNFVESVRCQVASLMFDTFTTIDRRCRTIGQPVNFSIRDYLTWTRFINVTCASKSILTLADAFRQGAHLVMIDSLLTKERVNADFVAFIEQFLDQQSQSLTEVFENAVSLPQELGFRIEPFQISMGPHIDQKKPGFFYEKDSSVQKNMLRVMRALQLDKPILLEGPPGVGKSSMISALAKLTGHKLIRINLSEQTDISDLFGADLPDEDSTTGCKFSFHEGPFLQALRDEGTWILLDEMNLASQTVLEGLNPCLDHRSEIFIPELNRTFKMDRRSTRIFAAQNPTSMDGSRKGLPKSFLNRFNVVHMLELTEHDYITILVKAFPQLSIEMVTSMVHFNTKILDTVKQNKMFAVQGGPFEFNLRDLSRWAEVTVEGKAIFQEYLPEKFVDLIYLNRFRSDSDRAVLKELANDAFDGDISSHIKTDLYQVGYSFLERKRFHSLPNMTFLLESHKRTLQSIMKCINMNWLAILIGGAGTGKTHLIKLLASLCGEKLTILSANNEMDVNDLLGGFEQKNLINDWHKLLEDIVEYLYSCIARPNTDKKMLKYLFMCLDMLQTSTDNKRKSAFISELFKTNEHDEDAMALKARFVPIERALNSERNDNNGAFEWINSKLVNAVVTGEWLLIDHANLLNASVLDRLNSVFEKDGFLMINEKGSSFEPIKPHENFRVFLAMDPQEGELSRAMKNRGIEIVLSDTIEESEVIDLLTSKTRACEFLNSELEPSKVTCSELFKTITDSLIEAQYALRVKTCSSQQLSSDCVESSLYQRPHILSKISADPGVFDCERDKAVLLDSNPAHQVTATRIFLEHTNSDVLSLRQKFVSPGNFSFQAFEDMRENVPYYSRFSDSTTEIKFASWTLTGFLHQLIHASSDSKAFVRSLESMFQISCEQFEEAIRESLLIHSDSIITSFIDAPCFLKHFLNHLFLSSLLYEVVESDEGTVTDKLYRITPVVLLYEEQLKLGSYRPKAVGEFLRQLELLIPNLNFSSRTQRILDSLKLFDNDLFVLNTPRDIEVMKNFNDSEQSFHASKLSTRNNRSLNETTDSNVRALIQFFDSTQEQSDEVTIEKNYPITEMNSLDPDYLQSDEFFAFMIVKHLRMDHSPERSKFFAQISALFTQKKIRLSPILWLLVQKNEDIKKHSDLRNIFLDTVQSEFKHSKLEGLFKFHHAASEHIAAQYMNSNLDVLTFESMPVIGLSLLHRFQMNQEMSVKSFFENRNSFQFFHEFMRQNYVGLMMEKNSSMASIFDSLNSSSTCSPQRLFRMGLDLIESIDLSKLPFDPLQMRASKKRFHQKTHEFLLIELELRRNLLKPMFGNNSFNSEFFQILQTIRDDHESAYLLEGELPQRICPTEFYQLVKSVTLFKDCFLNVAQLQQMTEITDQLDVLELDEIQAAMQSLRSFVRSALSFLTEMKNFSNYFDILSGYMTAVWMMVKACQEMIHSLQMQYLRTRFVLTFDTDTCFRFVNSETPISIAEKVFNFQNLYRLMVVPSNAATCNAIAVSSLFELENALKLNFDPSASSFKWFQKCTEQIVQRWRQERAALEDSEQRSNALFHLQLVDEPEDKDLKVEFPTCDRPFGDFIDEFKSLDLSVNQPPPDDSQQSEQTIFATECYILLIQIHMDLNKFSKMSDVAEVDFTKAYLARFQAITNFMNFRSGIMQKSTLERELLDGLLIVSDHIRNLQTSTSQTVASSFNVYKQSSVSEVSKCFDILHRLEVRVRGLLDEFESHAILEKIIEIVQRFGTLKIESPLMTFCAGLEIILKELEAWQQYAYREVKMLDFVQEITQLVVDWRSLEVQYWKHCLDNVDERIEKKQLLEWWFTLYCAIDEFKDNLDETKFLKSLKAFMENSNIGEFSHRLRIMDSIRLYLSLTFKNTSNSNKIIDILANCSHFYGKFSSNVAKAVQAARDPIEKQLKELVKISSWNPRNFWSLKESLLKTHRQLYSFMRKYEQALMPRAQLFFGVASESESKNLAMKWSLDTFNGGVDISKFEPIFQKFSSSEETILTQLSRLFSKSVKFNERSHRRIVHFCAPMVRDGEKFNIEVQDAVKKYSQMKPKEDGKDIDKWKKAVGQIQMQKRRALSDLFKALKDHGLSFHKGVVQFHEFHIDSVFLDHKLNLQHSTGEWNDPITTKHCQNADEHFHRCLTLFSQFIGLIETPQEELTRDMVERMKGFSRAMFKLVVTKREAILAQIGNFNQLMTIHEAVQKKFDSSGTAFSSFEELPQVLTATITALERLLSFWLRQRKISNIRAQEATSAAADMIFLPNNVLLEPFYRIDHFIEKTQENFNTLKALKKDPFLTVDDADTVHSCICNAFSFLSEFSEHVSLEVNQDVEQFMITFEHLANRLDNERLEFVSVTVSPVCQKLIHKILYSIQTVYQDLEKFKQDVASKAQDDAQEDSDEQFDNKFIFGLFNRLDSATVIRLANSFVKNANLNSIFLQDGQVIAPFLKAYVDLAKMLVELAFGSLNSSSSICVTLLNLFVELSRKGFCKPEEPNHDQSEDTQMKDAKNTGFGDGDTTGAEDVSDRLDCQDQLDDLKKEGDDEGEDDQKDDDMKNEDNGVEMDDDFEGQECGPDKEEQEDDDKNDDQSEDDNDEEFDDQMGDVEDNDEVLDENLWGDEDDEEDDLGDLDEADEKGKESLEKETVANEDDDKPDKTDDREFDENIDDEEEDEENEQPEAMNDDYTGEENNPGPQDETENTAMELPENIELDDIDGKEGEDEDEDEEEKEDADDSKENDDDDDNESGEEKEQEGDMEKIEDESENLANEEDAQNNINSELNENEAEEEQQQFEEEKNDDKLGNDSNALDSKQQNTAAAATDEKEDNDAPKEEESKNEGAASNDQESKITERNENASQQDENADEKEEISLQNEKSTKRTMAEESSKAKRQKIMSADDQERNVDRPPMKSDTVKHVDDADKADDVAMDSAMPDDADQDIEEQEKAAELADQQESMEIDPDDATEEVDDEQRKLSNKNKQQKPHNPEEGQDQRDTVKIDGDVVDTVGAVPEAKSYFETRNSNTLASGGDVPLDERMPEDIGEYVVSSEMVRFYEERRSEVQPLVYELCNQLQLVLEPTKRSKFKGDFKTGKRLNMRKVIAYVASDFRKDKIWLRRAKPSKRQYQILIAVDDSHSMENNRSKNMAFDSMILLSQALTIIEAGSLSITRFGSKCEVALPFGTPNSDNNLLKAISSFSFNQDITNYSAMLESALASLTKARQSSNSGSGVHQLLLIVSDGRGVNSNNATIQNAVVRLRELGVLTVFIIIDNPENEKSILDIQTVNFENGFKLQSYIELLPFPYYVVLKEVSDLPRILGDSLRQWIEMMSHSA